MMMTRVLMSRVDVDNFGVNGVHSGVDRIESEEIMMTSVLSVIDSGDDSDDPGVNDDDDDESGGDSDKSGLTMLGVDDDNQ